MTHGAAQRPATRRTGQNRSSLAAGIVFTLGPLVAGTALAQEKAGDPVQATTPVEQEPAAPGTVVCTVSGYDVIIHNKGGDPIASGASVEWSVPFARMDGIHVLTKDLELGGRMFLTGALGSNFLSSEAECEASLSTQASEPPAGDDVTLPSPPT
jgi:hypothetical protein